MSTYELVVIGAMVAINGFFAAYEIALASVSVSRLKTLEKSGHRGSRSALKMKDNMERSLAVVQLGITLVGAIAAATGGAGADERIAPAIEQAWPVSTAQSEVFAIALVVVPLTATTIIFGELVPKLFALRNKEWICLRLSPVMSWLTYAVWPAVWVLETSATSIMNWSERRWKPRVSADHRSETAELEELRAIASLARTARLIGAREENIILGAARLSGRPVGEIMLPTEHISMLHVNQSIAESLIVAHLDMHTRFPVAEVAGDPQTITGYVTFKDIVAHLRLSPQAPSLRSIVRAISSFPEELPISSTLESLMRERSHIALIRNAEGRVLGMVTLEDIVEELVGDIQDEYDLLPAHAVASGTGWVVGGGITLTRLRDLTGIDLAPDPKADGKIRNLTGWVTQFLGRGVRGGEIIEDSGARIVVRKIRRQRVLEAQVSQLNGK